MRFSVLALATALLSLPHSAQAIQLERVQSEHLRRKATADNAAQKGARGASNADTKPRTRMLGMMMGMDSSPDPIPTFAPGPTPPTATPPSVPVPPKALVCYSDEITELVAAVETTGDDDGDDDTAVLTDTETDAGSYILGTLSVPGGGSVMVEITASTGGVTFKGTESDPYPNFKMSTEFTVALGTQLIDEDSDSISPVPQAVVDLDMIDDQFNIDQDDWDVDDGMWLATKRMRSHSAKFFYPNLDEGDYTVQITVELEAVATLASYLDYSNGPWTTNTTVILGPHLITASVLDATEAVCPSLD